MKRWARRNLPTVVFLTVLLLLAALVILVIEIGKPQTASGTLPPASAMQPAKQAERFDEAAHQSRLLDEAYAPVEHETADIPSTYELPEPPQEADSEPCGKGDWERLAIVIYQEAGGDDVCDMCRYRVGDVVLNRVKDPRYPDTIEGVLTDDKYGLQWGLLSVTGVVWPEKANNPGEAAAVQRAWDIAADLLEGNHSDLDSSYIFCSEYKQGSDAIYCDGIYFGIG